MGHIRFGGVCLLLLVIAAALPICVLAQGQQSDAGSDSGSDATAQSAAASISKPSESSKADTISAEGLSRRNAGLKPLGSSSRPASQAASAQSSAAASAESTAASSATESTTESAAAESTVVTPSVESTEASATDESAATVSSTEAEPAAEEATVTPDTIQAEETPAPAATTEEANVVTPPEEAALGTAVSGNATEEAAVENASENATEEAATAEKSSENATEEEQPAEEEEKAAVTNRIWTEGDPSPYTWDYRIFSGFFYDMENDVGTEELTIDLDGNSRSVDEGKLTYKTEAKELDFEFDDWGVYEVIGFMADKYFAGYITTDETKSLFDKNISLLNEGELRKVLIDSDDENTIQSGSVLALEEGYELHIKQVDIDGNKVYLGLSKDGEEIDSKVVSPQDSLKSSTYEYKVDISGDDVPIIMAHVSNVFASTESNLVTIDGLFQLSDTYASVESGDEYGKMKVESVSDEGVEMENDNTLTLRRGSTVEIFGDVSFIVADADKLRFAPEVKRAGPHEVRGTVIDPSEQDYFEWTPYNFEGFYYDIDDDIGTEKLRATITGGTKIEEGDLVYSTSPSAVDFEFEPWGKYDVIGFMADKYFAGYNNQTKFADEASSINEGELRKVLIDDDTSQTIASGSVLSLEEGYDLRIKQVDINGNKVYLALAKDGEEVDSKVVTPSGDPEDRSSNYLYKVDIGSETDVPIIAVHLESVFKSTEADLATVDGIFQVSDSPESVEEGEMHGKMKVESLGDDGILMENDGTITLSRDRTIEIMDNLKFKVADSNKRLTAPIAMKAGEGADMILTIPAAVVGNPVTFTVKYGINPLSDVKISVNSTPIGTTDATGSLTYTPDKVGTFTVLAKKTGYNDGTGILVVRTAEEASKLAAYEQANATLTGRLTINAPAEVVKGEDFLITVVEGVNQTPVEGAALYIDDESIGSTGSQGSLTYAANITGKHTLRAEKDGFDPASLDISIVSPLQVTGLTLPEKAYVGSEMTITATVENTGSREDTRQLDLLVNDTVAASKNATLKGGENTTISFTYKPMATGLTRFSVDEQSKSINVEKAESKTWLIALISALLIAIGGGYYLYSKGELASLQKQIKNMMHRQ